MDTDTKKIRYAYGQGYSQGKKDSEKQVLEELRLYSDKNYDLDKSMCNYIEGLIEKYEVNK